MWGARNVGDIVTGRKGGEIALQDGKFPSLEAVKAACLALPTCQNFDHGEKDGHAWLYTTQSKDVDETTPIRGYKSDKVAGYTTYFCPQRGGACGADPGTFLFARDRADYHPA